MHRIAKGGATLLLIAIATAIFIQDHTDVLPLGLLNQERDQYTYLSNTCLIVTLAILVTLSVEAWQGRQWRFANAVRGCLVFLVVGELLLFGLDRLFVSKNPQSWLGGPYYERQTADGTWVFLKKAPIGSRSAFGAIIRTSVCPTIPESSSSETPIQKEVAAQVPVIIQVSSRKCFAIGEETPRS